MIPKDCKRLAEVDFPIAVVSKHAAREKSIRHGHPSTLHLWWARRPLAACRAMLLALLLPDPCDDDCPSEFKEEARELLAEIPGETKKLAASRSDEDLRKALLKFIGDFANWDLSSNRDYLEAARGLVKAAHGEEPPLVVDPFAGGGSIPLEALRLGCDAFASDLNPVACLILKTMLEDIPRHGPGLADELRRVGAEIKKAAEKELAEFYPDDPDGAKPIAYLWARTVRCESPNCGAEIPLVRSFWLSKKQNRKRALRYRVVRPKAEPPSLEFEILEPKKDGDVRPGTVTRAKATCPSCNVVLFPDRVRAQLRKQRGGSDVVFDRNGDRIGGACLLAVVTANSGEQGRAYRLPRKGDYEAILRSVNALRTISARELPSGTSAVPDELLPSSNTLGLRVPNYGFRSWSDLFSSRQKVALVALANRVRELNNASEEASAIQELLALSVSRTTDYCSANCSLHTGRDVVRNTWARNALPVVWDFYESVPCGDGSGNFAGAVDWVAKVAERFAGARTPVGQVQLADASESPLPADAVGVWFTDPPYYDAIGYAESSDFFFVWLKRMLPDHPLLRNPFEPESPLTPKHRECIQDDTYEDRHGTEKGRKFFEACVGQSFAEGRRILRDDGAGCVVFAHKTTEGWEALLGGILEAGWVITGSWPIETEMKNKVSGSQSGEKKAMLLASIHLVCRPRTENEIGDWGEVFRELPKRVSDWMERLQSEGIRGADLVFACIGPALEIYSRYAKVVDAEEREIPLGGNPEATEPHLRGYLAYVWEVVGRAALEQILGTAEARARNGAAGALEEDARLTALFLWTLQSTNGSEQKVTGNGTEADTPEDDDEDDALSTRASKKGFSLLFDVVRRFAQPLGIRLPEWEGRIIETKKGVVRLLAVSERGLQLFGEEGAGVVADRLETDSSLPLTGWLPGLEPKPSAPSIKGRGRKSATRGTVSDESLRTHREATTLDRVHAAMILQSSGRANALRALLKAEQERSPDFVRLANALSALYPKDSEEKRLLDAMLLAVPR